MNNERNRGHNVVALLMLSIDMANKRTAVDKYYVAEKFKVSTRTALRYLHVLHEVDLIEPIGIIQKYGNGPYPLRWKPTQSLLNMFVRTAAPEQPHGGS